MLLEPSLEECRKAALAEGMPEREGDKLFAHYTKVGWVCGRARVPMKSFAGAVLHWRLEWEDRGRPGANGNGHQPPMSGAVMMVKQKEYERVMDRLKKLGDGFWEEYNGERKRLRMRRDELRKDLGLVI